MVNASIDNEPVSIQLAEDESTTVPANETWKVTLSVFGRGMTSDNNGVRFRLNGESLLGMGGNMSNGVTNSPTGTFVLAGGDTLILKTFGAVAVGGGIQGFVVNS